MRLLRHRPTRNRLGLRARVAFSWALAAGVLSASVGGLSYYLVRQYLVEQRDAVAIRQAVANARVVRDTLRSNTLRLNPPVIGAAGAPGSVTTNMVQLLESLRSEAGSYPLLHRDGRWYGTASGFGSDGLPSSLLAALDAGISGRQRFHDGDRPLMAVGINVPRVAAQYVEVFPLDTLRHTLSVLRNALIAGSLAGLTFGGLFGWWSARRVLMPLRRVAVATEALARGALDTRLRPERDPDLNRVVASFNSMTDAVQTRIEREARFASDVSHELRTPLGTLSAAAEVLERRRGDMPERAGQAVDVITNQLRRLSSMVLDLLEIARIDAGVADVNAQDSEMAGLVALIADAAALPTEVVQIDRTHGPTRVFIDRRRFEQVLRNIIDNGQKYGDGIERILVVGSSTHVTIHVDDRGSGVPVGEREHIFERFVRGTETQTVPGTGLGLALASDQANLIGARLSVGDAPDRGARFTIVLNRIRDEDET